MRKIKLTTIGVLFAGNRRVYTYTAPARHGIKLGDEVIVDSPWGGPKVVFVVKIDKKPSVPLGWSLETLRPIRAKLVPL